MVVGVRVGDGGARRWIVSSCRILLHIRLKILASWRVRITDGGTNLRDIVAVA